MRLEIATHGLDMLMVRAGGDLQIFAPRADRGLASLLEPDAIAIRSSLPNVSLVSAVQNQRGITVVAGFVGGGLQPILFKNIRFR